jgi:cation diffusion facilitator CzcD-associated flavoprotein CzcO
MFQDENIAFDCFEASDRVGGNWVFKNKNGMSSAYRSLHINTSKKQMEFRCYPMPEDYPDFPHHSKVLAYFEDFAAHFNLTEKITFNTTVVETKKTPAGQWRVEIDNGQSKIYDILVVANGHHWDPRFPEPAFEGSFAGQEIHSHHYIDPTDPLDCRGKNVCIVGMGNSAMDIACELGHPGNANRVFLSVRRGTHILPKYFGGKPLDIFLRHPGEKPRLFEHFLPGWLFEKLTFPLLHRRVRSLVGEPEDFGLPKVKHRFGQTHPTISDEIHIRLGSGDVIPKPNIRSLADHQVEFVDGSREDIDVLIYATGYKISFPFLDQDYIQTRHNDVALFKRMVHPDHPNLLFLGLVQPLCSIMPIAECQARWMAKYISGAYHLPPREQMEKAMRDEHEAIKGRYVASKRHTIQINCLEYTYDLYREMKKGFHRAKKNNFAKPFPGKPHVEPTVQPQPSGESQYA